MDFLAQLWAIARNTALECLRQPVVPAVLLAGSLLVVMSIPFSGFTLMDDQRMFVDIALSTVFVSGTLLAAFLATSALSREIEQRTALTVVSKPVSRPAFVWGKFLGVAAALTAATAFLVLVFMLVEMHGTMQTVRTPWHQPVLTIGLTALGGAIAAAVWCNFLYGWNFPASTVGFGVPLLALAYALCLLFGKDWTPVPPSVQFEGDMWVASFLMWGGLMVLAGIAVAASTRFGQVVTLGITFGAFLLGLMSDWLVGRPLRDTTAMLERLAAEGTPAAALDPASLQWWGLKAAYAMIPNFQVFWLSDAIQQGRTIGIDYVVPSAAYAVAMVVAALSVAVLLFQRRDVG